MTTPYDEWRAELGRVEARARDKCDRCTHPLTYHRGPAGACEPPLFLRVPDCSCTEFVPEPEQLHLGTVREAPARRVAP